MNLRILLSFVVAPSALSLPYSKTVAPADSGNFHSTTVHSLSAKILGRRVDDNRPSASNAEAVPSTGDALFQESSALNLTAIERSKDQPIKWTFSPHGNMYRGFLEPGLNDK